MVDFCFLIFLLLLFARFFSVSFGFSSIGSQLPPQVPAARRTLRGMSMKARSPFVFVFFAVAVVVVVVVVAVVAVAFVVCVLPTVFSAFLSDWLFCQGRCFIHLT